MLFMMYIGHKRGDEKHFSMNLLSINFSMYGSFPEIISLTESSNALKEICITKNRTEKQTKDIAIIAFDGK